MAKSTPAAAAAVVAALPTAPYGTLERVLHNGKTYPKGNTVYLNVKDAARLLASNSVMAIKADTTAADANAAIDLKELNQAQLVQHATEVYNLTVTSDATVESLLEAIQNAKAAAAEATA